MCYPNVSHRSPGRRVLLGPGPSEVDPHVLRAMAAPVLGHLDPEFLAIMSETMELLRFTFNTANRLTIPMSGTGTSAMESSIVNFVEPGDRVIICVNGLFGQRLVDMAQRCGGEVTVVQAPWGEPIDPEALRKSLAAMPDTKVVGVVHAETSTGVRQPLADIAAVVEDYDALLVVDAVTSLGGLPVDVDETKLDVVYTVRLRSA